MRQVPGTKDATAKFSLVPDDEKYLVKSLPVLLSLLHDAGACIEGDFTLDDFMISSQYKFFLK